MLTTSADSLTGTSGNDTFVAVGTVETTGGTFSSSTLGSGDQIVGGAGIDTLSFTIDGTLKSASATAIPVPTISGVETINLRGVATMVSTSTITADANNLPGITAFNSDRSTAAVVVTNLALGASAGVIGNGTVTNGAFSADWKAGTAAILNVSGGTKGTGVITLTSTADIASTTINSTGAANTVGAITLDATNTALTINATTALSTGNITGFTGTAAKITASGAATNVAATATAAEKGAVSIGTIQNTTVKTIDASGLTAGGLEAVLSTNAAIVVTGGAGNDRITTGAVLTTGSVNAGTGTGDVLVIAAGGTHVADATLGGKYTNFEVLSLNDSQNVSFVAGINALELNAMTSKTVSGLTATQAAAITVTGTQTTGLVLTLADATGTADKVSLNLKSDTAATNVNVAGLSVIGVETLDIIGTTGTAATSSAVAFAAGGADKLTAINISGTADVSLTATNTAKAVTLISTTTGIATIAGDFVNASSITTGAGKDVITLGTGFATYSTGAGDDAISGTVAQLRTGASYNTINAGDGVDTVTVSDGAAAAVTMVDDDFKALTNVEKFVVTSTTTAAQSITTGGWFDANFKAAGADLTTTSTDGVIGITASSFTGNMTISATSAGTGAGKGTQTIATGSGNDKVTSVSDVTNTTTNVISTGAGNDVIIAGLGKDLITGGTGSDTMTGGGAVDTFAFGTNGSVIGTALDVITDFNTAGADVLTFGGSTTVLAADTSTVVAGSNVAQTTGGLVSFAAADSTLALKIAAVQADAQLDVAGSVAMFVDSGNTYVYYAGAAIGNADDQLIQLTGITNLATITGGATTTIAV